MSQSYVHLAIPVFFLLIGVELLVARLVERDVYRLSDSVNDLSCGILQQVAEVFLKTALFAGYAWLFAGHRAARSPALREDERPEEEPGPQFGEDYNDVPGHAPIPVKHPQKAIAEAARLPLAWSRATHLPRDVGRVGGHREPAPSGNIEEPR